MATNFPIDDEGNWTGLLSSDADPEHYPTSEKRIWKRSNPIVWSFLDQLKDFAPLKKV